MSGFLAKVLVLVFAWSAYGGVSWCAPVEVLSTEPTNPAPQVDSSSFKRAPPHTETNEPAPPEITDPNAVPGKAAPHNPSKETVPGSGQGGASKPKPSPSPPATKAK